MIKFSICIGNGGKKHVQNISVKIRNCCHMFKLKPLHARLHLTNFTSSNMFIWIRKFMHVASESNAVRNANAEKWKHIEKWKMLCKLIVIYRIQNKLTIERDRKRKGEFTILCRKLGVFSWNPLSLSQRSGYILICNHI